MRYRINRLSSLPYAFSFAVNNAHEDFTPVIASHIPTQWEYWIPCSPIALSHGGIGKARCTHINKIIVDSCLQLEV